MTDAVSAPAPAAPAAPGGTAAALLTTEAAAPAAPAAGQTETAAAPAPAAPQAETLAMPAKDAPPEEWEAFYNKLGRPETPDAYQLTPPEGADDSFVKAVAPLLHKAGLTPAQAKVMNEGWNQMHAEATAKLAEAEAAQIAQATAENEAQAARLQQEWGARHTEQMEFAKRAVTQFLPKEKAGDIVAAIESKIGYAETIKLMNSIGRGLAEHDAAGLGSANGGATQQKSLAERLYPNG